MPPRVIGTVLCLLLIIEAFALALVASWGSAAFWVVITLLALVIAALIAYGYRHRK